MVQSPFVPITVPPSCPKHHKPLDFISATSKGSPRGEVVAKFLCLTPCCFFTVVVPAPLCNDCKKPMKLKTAKRGGYYWRCSKDGLSDTFDACTDCGGTGWLEMTSDECAPTSAETHVIGHDGGLHIERCDGCGHHRFADDIEAELAHRDECGCGHGLPSKTRESAWLGYQGPNDEVLLAMHSAGFVVTSLNERVIEVMIPPDRADGFVRLLDETYRNLPRRAPVVDVDYKYLEERVLEESSDREDSLFDLYQRVTDRMVRGTGKGGRVVASRDTSLMHALMGVGRDNAGSRRESMEENGSEGPANPKRDPEAEKITPEYIKSIGLEQLTNSEGKHPMVNKHGFPIGTLRGPAVNDQIKANKPDRTAELLHASKKMLDALNSMNFQDHPKKEALELESRRRGLLEQMTLLRGERENDDEVNRVSRIRESPAFWGKFIDAGGYRVESLRQLEDEAVVQGVIYIAGMFMHIQFIQVHEVEGAQEPVNDPYRRYYDGVGAFNDQSMETTKLDGFPGEYVVFIFPRGR